MVTNMGIIKKLGDVARSSINALLNQLEDPKKLSELAIFELEESKKKAQSLAISAKALLKSQEKRVDQLKSAIAEIQAQAEQFLQNSDENAAREAIAKKQALVHEQESLSKNIMNEHNELSTLERGLKAIDAKINSLKATSIASSQSEIEKEDAFTTFARMEEKIETSEHELAALKELLAMEKSAPPEISTFDQHSDPAALEKELAAMKKKING